MKTKTKQLILNLKKEIERIEKLETISEKIDQFFEETQIKMAEYNFKKAQLQFAEKLIKAIKEDIKNCREPLLRSPEGNSNTHFLDYEKINKILDEAIK